MQRSRKAMVLKNYSKKEAVAIAVNGSRLYKNNFVGNKFLFVATNKHMKVESLEVVFPASSYMHLTGLICTHEDWTGLDFYNFCIDARLREEDIRIRKDGTTQQKLNILTSALSTLIPGCNCNYNQSQGPTGGNCLEILCTRICYRKKGIKYPCQK